MTSLFSRNALWYVVVQTSGRIILHNIGVWLVLVVVVQFFAWKIAWELWDTTKGYLAFFFSVDLATLLVDILNAPNTPDLAVLSSFLLLFFVALPYFALFQVLSGELLHRLLLAGRTRLDWNEAIVFFRTTEALVDILRTICIMLVQMAIYMSYVVVVVGLLVIFGFETATLVVMIPLSFALYVWWLRTVLAVPLTVVANTGVTASLTRSWTLTGPHWLQVLILLAVTAVSDLVYYLATFGIGLTVYGWNWEYDLLRNLQSSSLRWWLWGAFVIQLSVLSIFMGTCCSLLTQGSDTIDGETALGPAKEAESHE